MLPVTGEVWADLDNSPPSERLRHGAVDHGVETVAYDKDGRAVRGLAYRAIGTLERMARRGAIADEMVDAAERFRADFTVAALEPLRAAQLRERVGCEPVSTELSWRAALARRRVQNALAAVGHPGSSCLWAVVGEEKSLKEWAVTARISDENATGVLIAALGTLKAHYRL
jgi:hypothetical protein